jgi:precorrin-2 dehydrogenase/sirohydrochlorin ferrochelatase
MLDLTQSETSLFPMFLRLAGRHCLVVGAGAVAEGKITALLSAGARVTVVAPRARRRIACMARGGRIVWHKRKFRAQDLADVFLVVAATSSPQLHERIWRAARRRGVLCNVVDDPPRCDFYYPAIVRRGALQIAISTSGQSPALAQRLRRQLEEQFGPGYASWVAQLGEARRGQMRVEPSIARRKKFAHEMVRREFPRMLQTASARRLDRS